MANSNYSDSSMKVFVSNIPFATTDDDLVEKFRAAGAVADAHIFCRDDGRSSGQVSFASKTRPPRRLHSRWIARP